MRKDIAPNDFPMATSGALCCRYLAVYFARFPIPWHCTDRDAAKAAVWALGVHSDGESEVLGTWIQPDACSASRAAMFADLEARGVESVRFLVSHIPVSGVGGPLPVTSFGATDLPSIEQSLLVTLAEVAPRHRSAIASALRAVVAAGRGEAVGDAMAAFELGPWGEQYPQLVAQWRLVLAQWMPVFALPAPQRRVVLAGVRMAVELNESLVRAIARHGPFADSAAALAFVADRLQRAERRLDRQRAFVAAAVPRVRRADVVAHSRAS